MNGAEWRSTHVHYHASLDELALRAVRPLLRQLRTDSDIAAVYWQRHWRRGPHLRVNVRARPELHRGRVRRRVAECLAGYLDRFPSRSALDPASSRAWHTELAWWEGETAPLWPWMPDNTIREAGHDDGSAVLGGELAELTVASCVDTNDLAFTALEQHPAHEGRCAHAFDLLAATAHVACGLGVEWGFTALRAEAETVRTFAGGAALSASWREIGAADAEWYRARLHRLVVALDHGDLSDFPLVRRWLAHCSTYRPHIDSCVHSGLLRPPQRFGGQRAGRGHGASGLLLRRGVRGCGFRSAVRSTWFATYRVLLHLTDVHLGRIGLSALDRLRVCHLVASAVESVHGTSLPEALHRLPGRSDAAAMLGRALSGPGASPVR
ncbi:lantibiotic dehydratase C-terminal domain-containing protein [Salinifilum ghardaiensis]